MGIPIQAAEQPNFLVIVLDDLGWTNTSVQMDPNIPTSKSDYYRTPNLERMANEGMRFSNAYAGGPMCSPSRSALLTGRTPAQLQQTNALGYRSIDRSTYGNGASIEPIPFHLLDEFTTLPERLKQYTPEYSTALLHKSHTGSEALNYGFDIYDFASLGYLPEGENPMKLFSMTNHAKAYMEENVQSENPFFLMLAPSAIHAPYEYTTQAYADAIARPIGARHRSPQIAAELADVDNAIGQVLDKIDQLGISDNTYVIFTSDNGGTNGSRNNEPLFAGKGSLWEGGIRIPMIVKGPGIAPGSVSNVPVSGTDIFATLSELAGISAPFEPGLESASLVSLLHNGGQLPQGEILERGYGTNGELFFHFPNYSGVTTPASAVRDGEFKLVKLHGQAGASDKVYLFNLANSVAETSNLASPLNLATSMPAKTAELTAKLNGWLEEVDAQMPHNIATNAHLLWNASDLGTEYQSLWRSKNRVSDLRRESWEVIPERVDPGPTPPSQIAQRIDIAPHQPGLGSKAFEFDGNDLMARPFFNVSDAAHVKSDNSATFEFWFRLDDMNPNKPQVLMETGDVNGGLSLTLGDADNNGKSNDLRFRVRSINGAGYTVTVPVDQFANPVNDFVHATAVVNDNNDNRRIELYINGMLAGVTTGSPGAGNLMDWDNGDLAGIGKFAGTGLGGNGGSGVLPFNGGFDGQLAEMSFYSYALTASDIQSSYNSKLYPTDADIVATSGEVIVPTARPTDVSLNAIQSDSVLVMQERSDTLKSNLTLDAIINDGTILSSPAQAVPGVLPSGTSFTSYLFQLDPASSGTSIIEALGTVHFAGEILGVLFDNTSLALTDPSLGSIGNYGNVITRGLTLGDEGSLTVADDLKSVSFDLAVEGDEMLQFRVLTTLVSFLEADFDESGAVDDQDLAIWQRGYGQGSEGDADGDGDTDGRDFLVWQRQFAAAGVSGITAVPEPATCSILMLLAMAGLSLRTRRRA